MKKTIIATLALSSIALGVETLDTLDSELLEVASVTIGATEGDTISTGNNSITFAIGEGGEEEKSLSNYIFTFGFNKIPTAATDPWLRLTGNNYGIKSLDSTGMALISKNWETIVSNSITVNTTDTFTLTRLGSSIYFSNLSEGTYVSYTIPKDELNNWDLSTSSRIYTNNGTTAVKVGVVADLTGLTQEQVMTIANCKYHVIPEPTTATLSLLALAGLAARRRRK